MTLLFSSLLLDDTTKLGWCVAKRNHPRTSGSLSPPLVAEHQTVWAPRALLKLHQLYAQLALKELTSLSLETATGQRTGDEAGDKKVEAGNPASKRVKQKP